MSAVRTALVIGGGIAGPVAATALVRAGIETTMAEAYPPGSEGIGSSLALAPNGLSALGAVGAEDAVRAVALPLARMAMQIGERRVGTISSLPGLPPVQVVERGDLHRVLHARAADIGVTMAFEKRLVAVDERADGVTARFADGSTLTADVLVGADGVRSTVRRLIDPAAPDAGYTGMLGFGGLADVEVPVPSDTMTFAFGRRAYYLYWPQPGGGTAWGANLPYPQELSSTVARRTPAEEWLRVLREAYAGDVPGAALAAGTAPEDLQVVGALHIMPPVPHWYRGRMVLVGDAVHAPSNSTGQGASLAIESAVQLARCLRDLPDVPSAFAAYEGLRRARVEKVAARGARINHTKTPGPVARRLMPLVLPLMFRGAERTLGAEQRHTIDWDAPVAPVPVLAR